MVSTDTRGCGSYMGHRSVALTWSSVVDDRPDRSSRTGRRHRRNVCRECSSKSIHCSKVHGSYHPRTIGLDSFTRRPVWTRRASHPAPSGRPPRGGAKVTWFRYSCEYRRYSREDAGELLNRNRMQTGVSVTPLQRAGGPPGGRRACTFLRSGLVVAPWNLSLAAWNTEPETAVGCPAPEVDLRRGWFLLRSALRIAAVSWI